jgi:thymidylate synthase
MPAARLGNTIEGDDIGCVYDVLLSHLSHRGQPVTARGFETREIINLTLRVESAQNNILVSSYRNPNYRFMVAEWLWIAFGLSTLAPLTRVNGNMAKFSDDGITLTGAYGPRIAHQTRYILQTLINDRYSRQAVLTIWTPNPNWSKDIPCTISMQFLIRNDKLHGTVTMRSSDAWLGVPYDFFTFSQLLNSFAGCLGVDVGSLTMNLGSSHLYKEHVDQAVTTYLGVSNCVKSPVFSGFPPASLEYPLITGLRNKISGAQPWSRYHNALVAKTSAEALLCLKEEV